MKCARSIVGECLASKSGAKLPPSSIDQGGGKRRAVEQGKQLGRPKVGDAVEKRISKLLRAGVSIAQTARSCRVGHSTVQRVKAAL